jgi:hypothetical protein
MFNIDRQGEENRLRGVHTVDTLSGKAEFSIPESRSEIIVKKSIKSANALNQGNC